MMAAMFAYLHFGAQAPVWIEVGVALVFLAVSAFIVTRPGRAPQ